MQNFVKKLPNKIDEFIGEDGAWVSGGQRQRLGIARLLFQNPNLMILMNLRLILMLLTKNLISTLIKLTFAKTILFITHRINTLQSCDNILVMNNGMIESQ